MSEKSPVEAPSIAAATESLPPRQRATAADTRLTTAEWGLLSVLTLMQFCVTLDFVIMMPLGPQLMRVFTIDVAWFSYAVGAYSVGAGLSSFGAAFYLDRFDRKRVLLTLFAGFALGTFCCALAPSYYAMLIARFVTGTFGGVCGGVVLSIVGDAIPEVRRATAMGTVMSAFGLASALGIPLGLWFAEAGWHWPFLILGGLCVLILPFALWLLPRSDRHLIGASAADSPSAHMWAVLANARHLRALGFMALLTTAGFMIVPFISDYMVRNVGLSETQLKWNFLSGGVFTLLCTKQIGRLADMYGRLRVFAIMAILASGSVLWLTHLGASPLWVAILVSTVFTVMQSGRFVPAIAMITGSADARHRGGFMSMNSCVQSVFAAVGSSLGGWLIVDRVGEPLRQYGLVGWISAALTVVCIGLATRLRRPESELSSPRDTRAVVEAI